MFHVSWYWVRHCFVSIIIYITIAFETYFDKIIKDEQISRQYLWCKDSCLKYNWSSWNQAQRKMKYFKTFWEILSTEIMICVDFIISFSSENYQIFSNWLFPNLTLNVGRVTREVNLPPLYLLYVSLLE